MFVIAFHPEAANEYKEAVNWYEKQKGGLGKRFELAVEITIQKLQSNPENFHIAKKPFREASIPLFPYVVIFKINKRKNTVFILAVYHTSRNPKNIYRR